MLEQPARAVHGAGNAATEFRTAWQGLMDSFMDQISAPSKLERERLDEPAARPRRRKWRIAAALAVLALGLFFAWLGFGPHKANQAAALPTPAPLVTVSQPLQRSVD